jgi:hypothetical protein
MLKTIAAATAAAALLCVAACGQGSAEKTGENMDSAVEQATQGHENLGDGPMEKAGEQIDQATGNTNNTDPVDAIHDATDGDPSTK